MYPLYIHIFLRGSPEIFLLRIYLTWWHHISKNNSNMALWKEKQTTKSESLFSVPCCLLIMWWASLYQWEYFWKQLKFQHLHYCFALWQQPPRTAKMKAERNCTTCTKIYITPPLQKSTIKSPGFASFVTAATKLFSCCCFLRARSLDIFPGDDRENA